MPLTPAAAAPPTAAAAAAPPGAAARQFRTDPANNLQSCPELYDVIVSYALMSQHV